MKATIDVPDELYRRVKAKTALQGRAIREVTAELYRRWLAEEDTAAKPAVSAYEMMEDGCGMVHSGVGDLSTNPKHMEGLGSDLVKPGGRFADGCGIVNSGVGDLSWNPKHLEGLGRE